MQLVKKTWIIGCLFTLLVRSASAEVINSLLTVHPYGVREKHSNGSTCLHSASSRGDLDLVLLLLNGGANPNVKDNGGRTPRQVTLHYSGYMSSRKTIQDILERWPVLMMIKLLRKLRVFHWVDLSMMDLYEYIGQEEDFVAANLALAPAAAAANPFGIGGFGFGAPF